MTELLTNNMAPMMFGALVVFLLLGYPVAFALAANGILFGLVGIELARLHQPDLMIVDARLGRGSGIVAVEEILRARPVAHFFLSGDAEGVRMLRPGAVVVRKPFRRAELARAIDLAVAAVAVPT